MSGLVVFTISYALEYTFEPVLYGPANLFLHRVLNWEVVFFLFSLLLARPLLWLSIPSKEDRKEGSALVFFFLALWFASILSGGFPEWGSLPVLVSAFWVPISYALCALTCVMIFSRDFESSSLNFLFSMLSLGSLGLTFLLAMIPPAIFFIFLFMLILCALWASIYVWARLDLFFE